MLDHGNVQRVMKPRSTRFHAQRAIDIIRNVELRVATLPAAQKSLESDTLLVEFHPSWNEKSRCEKYISSLNFEWSVETLTFTSRFGGVHAITPRDYVVSRPLADNFSKERP